MIPAKKYGLAVLLVFALSLFIKPAISLILAGGLVLYLGIASIIFLQYITREGIESTGIILEYKSDSDGYKTPIIEFTTWSGELISAKPYIYASTDLSKIRTYKNLLNQSITVLYDAKDPKKFVVASEEGFNYLLFAALIIAGLIFIAVGICVLLGYINLDMNATE